MKNVNVVIAEQEVKVTLTVEALAAMKPAELRAVAKHFGNKPTATMSKVALVEMIMASVPQEETEPETAAEILGAAPATKTRKNAAAKAVNPTTVPYNELAVGTVLQAKNGTPLVVICQVEGGTMLASSKIAWTNTNPIVTGLGSEILVEGTGTLPAAFENSEYNVCLALGTGLLAKHIEKEEKAQAKAAKKAAKAQAATVADATPTPEAEATAEPQTVEAPTGITTQAELLTEIHKILAA